jgi:tryptophan 7-halogenase
VTAMPSRSIVIAGGGSAGWMTAAALAVFLGSQFRISLVESEQIGIVGVGEAAIPPMRSFNESLGIDENEFLRETQGSFKLAIEFVDWLRPGHRYMHAFGDVGRDVGLTPFQHLWHRARQIGKAGDLGLYALNEVAGRAGRMHRGGPMTGSALPTMPYAFHFDASLYARYLRKFAEARGVVRHEGIIQTVKRDGEGGDVTALTLDDGTVLAGDFFIDCTGFRGVLIEETLGAGYEDWSEWLPCDRAVAMPCTNPPSLRPYTQSIAHPVGWQWRIPLQHRTGNGRVYCSRWISDDEAAASLIAGIEGEALADPRFLRFTAGRRKQAWVRNVVSIGLAGGFLEPLESTSIHLIQSGIVRLLKLLPGAPVSAALRDEYNRQTAFEYERIRDFIILHYWANQREEPFWRERQAMNLPETLTRKIELFRQCGVIVREQEELFTEVAWLQVLVGQGIEPQAHHPLADQLSEADLTEYMRAIELLYAREAGAYASHGDFISRHCRARELAPA